MLLEQEPPVEGEKSDGLQTEYTDWLRIAEEAYDSSTDYLDENYRKQWERNVSNFKNQHPSGSKYYSEPYKFRSRLFRPKTRSAVRRAEAAFAQAMFATRDVITLDPVDQSDKEMDDRTKVWEAILNYRLKYSIPWFLTAVGAFQEAKIYGIVASRQDWLREDRPGEDVTDEMTGETIPGEPVILENRPRIELLEIENLRFDPGAKWYDPIETSPYFIELMPMYVGDVLEMMEAQDSLTGRPLWKKYDRTDIIKYGQQTKKSNDTVSRAREGKSKTDPKDHEHQIREFEIVWVHKNYVRKDGVDWEFYTLTTRAMLSEPVESTSILGRRPYRIGIASLEAHRTIPSSEVELQQGLQAEANDIVNQRLDNVKLVLNQGHIVKRDAGTDLLTLKRSYPGRIVLTDDPDSIKTDKMPDVTGSSYQEQDRLNADIDDLTGGFSAGSVMTNRKLGETVGGMNKISQSGGAIQGYSVRTFVETWVEPVLTDIVTLIQAYESNELIDRFARTANVQMPMREDLTLKLSACVSVGFGELDPRERVKSMVESLMVLAKIAPWAVGGIDIKSVAQEIFSPIGYRDGSKFFANLPDGPPQREQDPMVGLKEQQLIMDKQYNMARLKMEFEIKMMEMALKEDLTREQLYSKLDLDMDKLNLEIMKEMTRRDEIRSRREEMVLKTEMGQGI